MRALSCAATRRRLDAFHDEELPISDQVSVGAHLDWCDDCASAFAELRLLRAALRAATPGRMALSREEDASLLAAVVNRVKAERTVSFASQVQDMFEDMHFVYAGIGAAAAAMVCVVIMLGMMRLAASDRLESLAEMAGVPGSPGLSLSPVPLAPQEAMPRPLEPRVLDQTLATAPTGGGDSVIMLAAVVTREGTITNLELLEPDGGRSAPGTSEAKAFEDLLGAVSRARFERVWDNTRALGGKDNTRAPGKKVNRIPVAVNMVWLVEHTTVRARPAAKKRTASLMLPPRFVSV
jgi:hypothetical protein